MKSNKSFFTNKQFQRDSKVSRGKNLRWNIFDSVQDYVPNYVSSRKTKEVSNHDNLQHEK